MVSDFCFCPTFQILGQITLRKEARAKRLEVVDFLEIIDRHSQAVRVGRVQPWRELQGAADEIGSHFGHPLLLARVIAHADRDAFDKELGVMFDDVLQQQLRQFDRRHHREADVHDHTFDQLMDGRDLGVVRVDGVVHVDLGDVVRQPIFDVPLFGITKNLMKNWFYQSK